MVVNIDDFLDFQSTLLKRKVHMSENRKIGSNESLIGPDKRDSACAGLHELTEDQTQELESFQDTLIMPVKISTGDIAGRVSQ